jgi:uncharacterized protein with von Willebrand factor type A (vWA) domain
MGDRAPRPGTGRAAPAGPGAAPDVAAFAARLGRKLRAAGLSVTPERSARFARALQLHPPVDRAALYWDARLSFVSAQADVAVFDAVFAAVFDGRLDPADSRGQDAGLPPPRRPGPVARTDPGARPAGGGSSLVAALMGGEPVGGSDGRDAALAAASPDERLAERELAELTPAELERLRALARRLALRPPMRRSRRVRRARRGPHVDVRATLRRSLRTGGDPVRLRRRRRVQRPRRVVMLLDVSGSMEPYARALAMLLQGAVGGLRAEVFVFATRLTRVTRALAGPAPERAIAEAASAAPDWAGGTRIGAALRAFNDGHGRRGLARGAVVVILSDGWEREAPEQLGAEMARLRRLAHRIVWVNPRSASPAFAPLAGGMAAALPYCDDLLPGHSLAALEAVADAVTRP